MKDDELKVVGSDDNQNDNVVETQNSNARGGDDTGNGSDGRRPNGGSGTSGPKKPNNPNGGTDQYSLGNGDDTEGSDDEGDDENSPEEGDGAQNP